MINNWPIPKTFGNFYSLKKSRKLEISWRILYNFGSKRSFSVCLVILRLTVLYSSSLTNFWMNLKMITLKNVSLTRSIKWPKISTK